MTPRRLTSAILLVLILSAVALPPSPAYARASREKRMNVLALHPDNPHYFVYKGRPTILITSGEHYGAVLNLDFPFEPYLETLHADGLNLTRTFTGAYMEQPGNFGIAGNTLAPLAGRLICPWKRSDAPGYANGGNKFDLNAWDDAYFQRLRAFLKAAEKNGVIVELSLFCPFYEDAMWDVSPMNAKNNVNGVGNAPREEVYALKHADLTDVQDRMVRKIVSELKDAPNFYYELCNEPYFGGVTKEWQAHISQTIADAEKGFPHPHLIGQNINNGSEKVTDPNPLVSVFSFHYAHPPVAVEQNYGLNKVVSENETGFRGTADVLYRSEAWGFILAGGGEYNNLDYSFIASHPKGDYAYPDNQPGGGSPALRKQLHILKRFIEGFDFLRLKPDNSILKGGIPDGATARALVEPGKAYALYLLGGTEAALELALPEGHYRAEWVDTKTGEVAKREDVRSTGAATLHSPAYTEDIALRILAR